MYHYEQVTLRLSEILHNTLLDLLNIAYELRWGSIQTVIRSCVSEGFMDSCLPCKHTQDHNLSRDLLSGFTVLMSGVHWASKDRFHAGLTPGTNMIIDNTVMVFL